MPLNLPSDKATRTRALTDLQSTLLVEAAAGTGKTALIAGRVTVLLARGADPANIAAITFTELAASELSARVHLYAKELLKGNMPTPLALAFPNGLSEDERRTLASAAERLDQLTAATIHSFCQKLICSYAVEADIDPGAQVIDADQADAAFQVVVDKWLRKRLNQIVDAGDPIAVLSRATPRKVVLTLRQLARFRLKYRRAQTLPADLSGRPDLALAEAVSNFGRWLQQQPSEPRTLELFEHLERLANFYADTFENPPDFEQLWKLAHPPFSPAMRRESSDLLRPQLKAAWERAAGKGRGAEAWVEMLQCFELVDQRYRTILGRVSTAIVANLATQLQEILNEYAQFKRSAAVLDFEDLIEKAQDLIHEHEAVRAAIGRQYRHILVDEFQDTDSAQCEILFGIAGESRAVKWHDTQLRPGALFLVGDPKQAIYRFRGANVETYLQARAAIENHDTRNVLNLTANFRSRPSILEHVNRCFESPLSKSGQPGYVALTPTLEAPTYDLPCISKLEIDPPSGSWASQIREVEAAAVAELCVRLIGTFEFSDGDGRPTRLTAGGIALLAPTYTSLSIYEQAFRERGLPFVSQAGKGLYRRQETQDLLALIRILANPWDTVAFGALMRGPLVGLTDQELLDITAGLSRDESAKPQRFTVFTELGEVSHPVARQVLTILQDLRRRSRSTTPALLLSEAVEHLLVIPILAAREGDRWAQAAANVEALIERARNYDVKGLKALARDVGEDWENEADGKEGRVDADGAISVITIHSAKGLEWPVVIPINTITQLRQRESFVHRTTDNTVHWIIEDVVSPELEEALAWDGESASRERERLMYVACTRARELLIVPELKEAQPNTWSRIVNLALQEVPAIRVPSTAARSAPYSVSETNEQTSEVFEAEGAAIARASVPLTWRRASDRDPDRQPLVEVATPDGDVVETASLPVGAGRVRGLVLHKLMEEVLTGEIQDDLAALTQRALALIKQLMVARPGEASPEPDEMAAVVLRTLAIPEIVKFRPRMLPELSVYAMTSRSAESPAALAGRIDALVVDEGQTPLPIDWKSDVAPTDHDIASHSVQLEDYLRALGSQRGVLVYMTTGRVHWVDLPPGDCS